jgi:hypothetical protein
MFIANYFLLETLQYKGIAKATFSAGGTKVSAGPFSRPETNRISFVPHSKHGQGSSHL